jgi:hypothetical protein
MLKKSGFKRFGKSVVTSQKVERIRRDLQGINLQVMVLVRIREGL